MISKNLERAFFGICLMILCVTMIGGLFSFEPNVMDENPKNLNEVESTIKPVKPDSSIVAVENLVGYWTFDGNAQDISPNALHISSSCSYTDGRFGQAITQLEGQAIGNTISTSILNTDQHTISFWIRFPAGTVTNSWQSIFYYPGSGDRTPGIWRNPALRCIHWRYNPLNTGVNALGPTGDNSQPFNPGRWYHIVGVKDNANLKMYVDGVQVVSTTVAYPKQAGNSPCYFGNAPGYSAAACDLDDFRIYNRPLISSEISDIYAGGDQIAENVLWWDNNTQGQWENRFRVGVTAKSALTDGTVINQPINFTDQLLNMRFTGTLDTTSIRVVEWNYLLHQNQNKTSTFTPATIGYSASTNATGILSWTLNGTTPQFTTRNYYVYFNTIPNQVQPRYNTNNYGQLNNLDTSTYTTYVDFPIYRNQTETLASVTTANWWDNDWLFRVNVNCSASGTQAFSDKLIEYPISFTDVLRDIPYSGTFDENSIRILEWDDYFQTYRPVDFPYQFEKDLTYSAEANALGTLCWVLDGKTTPSRPRIFFIYFDVLEYGSKTAADFSGLSSLVLTTKAAGSDYSIENSKIRISLCQGTPTTGGSGKDHIYEVYDKRTGRDLQYQDEHAGWCLNDWNNYGGLTDSAFDRITSLSIVNQGPVRATIKAIFDYDTFIYEQYYTMNYLDDTIRMTHKITAKSAISQGNYLNFITSWSPGYGTSLTAPNSAYGLGGYDFGANGNTNIDGSRNFTSIEAITSTITITEAIRRESWYVQWDEARREGIGTIWEPVYTTDTTKTYISEISRRNFFGSITNDEGRMSFRLVPQALATGQSFSFSIWGMIFNNATGSLVKMRAKGIQQTPQISLGTGFAGNKLLQVSCLDTDSQSISNAYVIIQNSTNQDIRIKQTDSNGKVIFKGMYSDSWNILVNYTIGNLNFTIKNESYIISGSTWNWTKALSCNLTTLQLTVIDETIYNPLYSGLYNANITLVTQAGENFSSYYTNAEGKVNIKLPQNTQWNFTVQYQGKQRIFLIHQGSEPGYFSHNITITTSASYQFNCTIADWKSRVNIVQVDSIWYHQNQTTEAPYSIRTYAGDNVTIKFYFESFNPSSSSWIGTESENGGWELLFNNMRVNSSDTLSDLLDISGGYRTITLYTANYLSGDYVFNLNMTRNTPQSTQIAYYSFILTIWNFTTSIYLNGMNDQLSTYYNTNFSIQVIYSSISPESRPIPDGILKFQIESTAVEGFLQYQETTYLGAIYNLTWNATLNVGIYSLKIMGNATNYAWAETILVIQINAIVTNFNLIIPTEYRVSNMYLKAAYGENITFTINFTDANGHDLGEDVSVKGYFDENIIPTYPQGNGLYLCSIPANNFPNAVGLHSIRIDARKTNYITRTSSIDGEILDYWDTELVIIDPPTFYPWGNNASFIIRYACNEFPRAGLSLQNAEITQLNITYKINVTEYNRILLTSAQRGLDWNWFDLKNDPLYGEGFYLIWFNTNIVNVTQRTAFYAIPSINVSIYRQATARPYVWIAPVGTTLTPTTPSIAQNIIEELRLKLDQNAVITAHLNVTEDLSSLLGNNVNGARVTYRIVNESNENEILIQGDLAAKGNGLYEFTIYGYRLGNYRVRIIAVIENYTTSVASFLYKCELKPIEYAHGLNILRGVVETPQNMEISFAIIANDTIANGPLRGATMIVLLNDQEYVFQEDPNTPGLYVATFDTAVLKSLEIKSYVITVKLVKENYTIEPFTLTMTINLPVDPYLRIPFLYWTIIGITIGAMVGMYVVSKAIQNARIPLILKQIELTRKLINSKKSVDEENITLSINEEILERFRDDWKFLDIDLEAQLGIKKKLTEPANMTSGDNPGGAPGGN